MERNEVTRLAKANTFVARLLCKFLFSGSVKAYGVILTTFLDDFKTTHFILGCSFALQMSSCNISSPLVKFLRRFAEYKTLYMFGGMLAAAGYFCRAIFPMNGIWVLFIYSAITGIGFGLCNISSVVYMERAFRDSFPTAYSISLFAAYFGIAILPLLSEYLFKSFGIRVDMTVFGALCLIMVPVGLILPSKELKSSDKAQQRRGEEHLPLTAEDFTRRNPNNNIASSSIMEQNRELSGYDRQRETVSTKLGSTENLLEEKRLNHPLFSGHPDFLLVWAIGTMFGLTLSSWAIFLIPFGESAGLDSSTAVVMSLFGGIGGVLGDLYCICIFYKGLANILSGFALPSFLVFLSFIVTLISSEFPALALYSFISGFGIAVQGIASTSFTPSTLCDDHFEVAIVLSYFTGGIAAQLGSGLTGALIDITGSFSLAFGLLSVLNLFLSVVSLIWWIVRKNSTNSFSS
ncbi:monocarboxylate transporter 14-like [Apostichopus japonicus]|uniref:monocarboxylate transporter 14-like n=1 Tax=Stichopus japonicus TaxID=307972 RepID=UPI003AB6DFDE